MNNFVYIGDPIYTGREGGFPIVISMLVFEHRNLFEPMLFSPGVRALVLHNIGMINIKQKLPSVFITLSILKQRLLL